MISKNNSKDNEGEPSHAREWRWPVCFEIKINARHSVMRVVRRLKHMDLIPLLGSNLKSDTVIELLELWDCDVIYDFDRLHENTPDRYWASSKSEGLQVRFDEDQVLQCVFVYVAPSNGDDFSAADLINTDIPQLSSTEDVLAYAELNQLQTNGGRGVLFDQVRDWVRIEYPNHSIHYEFRDGALGLVTISKKS